MTHQEYMQLALRLAKKSQQDGGTPIGAVLVNKIGQVFSVGESLVGVTNDPTSHAEINCIRAACTHLGSDHLEGFTLYCTLEPCHMCLGCAAWAHIQHIYFGAYRKDVDPVLFDTLHGQGDEAEAANMNIGKGSMHVQGGILEVDCAKLLNADL